MNKLPKTPDQVFLEALGLRKTNDFPAEPLSLSIDKYIVKFLPIKR